jgi:hypothetical protein
MKNFWIKDELDACIKLLQSWLLEVLFFILLFGRFESMRKHS